MSKQLFTVSDLSGQPILNDEDAVAIIVHDHPSLEHAVQLDASVDEISSVEGLAQEFVLIELVSQGGDTRQRAVLELAQFDKLFDGDPQETLLGAEAYDYGGRVVPPEQPKRVAPKRRTTSTPAASAKPGKTDYRVIENAGRVHRGRITDAEKLQVQQNFAKVNENLARLGERTLDLANPEHVSKYGLEKLAAGAKAQPGFSG